MKTWLKVENVRACGCSNSILKGLSELPGVFGARVDTLSDCVVVDHTDEIKPGELARKLRQMGYRLSDEKNESNNDKNPNR